MNFGSQEFRFAFRTSIPVLLGYVSIGLGFGLILQSTGFPWWISLAMSVLVYAGAMQYLAVGLLGAKTGLAEIALLTLLVNARHAVYGLSLLQKFADFGSARLYLIFALTDETYALETGITVPPALNGRRVYSWISALDQAYWVAGSLVGSIAGSVLPIPTRGLGFALSALFLVLLCEQWLARKSNVPFMVGAAACVAGIAIAGRASMLLPSIGIGLAALLLIKEKKS